ncbi:MAG: hypothetical protein AB1791_07740 [Chloroflexota bacterium]
MGRIRVFYLLAAVILGCGLFLATWSYAAQPTPPQTDQSASDDVGVHSTSRAAGLPRPTSLVSRSDAPAGVLYDNGPLVNSPGTGVGGADESVLQNFTLGMSTLGFGHQLVAGNRIADDFTISDPYGWQIDQITFYAYQSNSGNNSTMTAVNYRIWDGPPNNPASVVVFGDTTTNRLITSTWSNIYRVTEESTGNNTERPVMVNVVSAGVILTAGDYWLDWQTDGTLTSGPWAPPVTINGQSTTGNGLRYQGSTGLWSSAVDSGTNTPQDFPFILEGTVLAGYCAPGFAIPDDDPAGVSSSLTLTNTHYLLDMDVILSATHSWVGDLSLTLTHDDTGISVTLVDRPGLPGAPAGCSGNDLHNTLDDEASLSIEDDCTSGPDPTLAYIPGEHYAPNEPLSAFDYELLGGSWTLTATDNAATNVGNVNLWCLAPVVGQPAVTLTKTVGLESNLCATGDYLVVEPGAEVTYCYQVTNTGTMTLTTHDLVDTELGPLLTGFFYDLPPGATTLLTTTVTMTQTAVNTATWTASVAGGPSAAASDSATVIVAGDEPLVCNGPAAIFAEGIPDNWRAADNLGTGVVWTGTGEAGYPADCGEDNYTGGEGVAACVSSDEFGRADYDTELWSPAFDLSGYLNVTLDYLANFQAFRTTERLDLDISDDDGSSWTNLLSWNSDHGSFRGTTGEAVSLDLSTYAGQSDLILRWHYYDTEANDWNWYAEIDEVSLSCDNVPRVPDVAVEPAAISSTQSLNVTTTWPLTVSNGGNATLTWTIDESPPGLSPMMRATRPTAVLYDQTDSPGLNSITSQEFEEVRADFDSQAADDFVVPAGETWTVETVYAGGVYFNGPGPTPYVNVYFYADSGGLPGDELTFYDGLTSFSDVSGTLTIDLSAAPAVLPEGTYWVSVQADMDFTPGGQWGWTERTIQSNNPSAWRNPGDGYATGCADWEERTLCGIGSDPDLIFQLLGTSSSGGEPGCAPGDITWATVSPTSGETAAGESSPITITFHSAGLTAGVYTGTLCLSSNDPDESQVQVPLTLTVETAPAIAVDPAALSSTQFPNTQVTQSLTISNGGTADLDWIIEEEPPGVRGNLPSPWGGGPGVRVSTILYDNGPLINSPGTGVGGADESIVQTTSLGMTNFGFGHQLSAGNRVADDFTISDANGWWIGQMIFYAYQTGSGNSSTITAVNFQIWDGPPNHPASRVVFGDTTTNRLTSTAWGNIYRVTEGTTGSNTERPVMVNVVSAGVALGPGTYWLDWQTDGLSSFSGPWAPPITINGLSTTGDALQYTPTGGWAAIIDTGTNTAQGLPFVVEGSVRAPCAVADIAWFSAVPAAGTTLPGGRDSVTATFDSSGLTTGIYTGTLCIGSNDPRRPLVLLPISLVIAAEPTPTPSPTLTLTPTNTPTATPTLMPTDVEISRFDHAPSPTAALLWLLLLIFLVVGAAIFVKQQTRPHG